MIKNFRVHLLSRNLSPLTHMRGTEGNEAIINREVIYSGGVLRQVPVISGNAIRHRMVREPGAWHLVKTCGLEGKLTIDQANYLFNGGSLTESSISENLTKIAEMQELMPLVRLLGGSLRNQIVGGSLIALRGILMCEENRDVLERMIPDCYLLPAQALRPAETFVGRYQYTRGDAMKRGDSSKLIRETPNGPGSNLMIYSGQTVISGALWYHGFILQNVDDVEVGALMNALMEWDAAGATLGGMGRIGHGRLETSFFLEGDSSIDVAAAVAKYREHLDANKSKIVDWLNATFPEGRAKGKK